jgi:hypothetical protein
MNMRIKIYNKAPTEWKGKTPIESYETRMFYTGFSRYNVAKRTLSQLFKNPDGSMSYTEQSCDVRLFPRVYHSEDVQITVYSRSPMVWKEEISVDDVHFFVQQPIQTAST